MLTFTQLTQTNTSSFVLVNTIVDARVGATPSSDSEAAFVKEIVGSVCLVVYVIGEYVRDRDTARLLECKLLLYACVNTRKRRVVCV